MTAAQQVLAVAAAILGAILLDFWLLRLWRRRRQRGASKSQRQSESEPEQEGVYVFGDYSPLLTWLKHRRWRRPAQTAEDTPAQEHPPTDRLAAETQPPGVTPPLADAGLSEARPDSLSLPQAPASTRSAAHLDLRWLLLEVALLILAVILFTGDLLDIGQPTRLPGNETQIFQTLDWVLLRSLRDNGTFPLWNPYLRSGLPYVADPMLHAYNPLVSLPVLLYGPTDGFKVAVVLSYLVAAFGMWFLGKVLGMDRPVRIWAALMFIFAGQPVARFFQGQYLFVFGFAWIPWAFAGLLGLLRSGRRIYLGLSVLALALILFSGNVYYAFYMLIACTLLALVMVLRPRRRPPYLSLDFTRLKRLAAVAVLVVGVIAIQLLPLAQFWPRINKATDLAGQHTLRQIYLDFTSRDTLRPDAFPILPAREEYYAYIGISPFLALLLLPFTWRGANRRFLIFLSLLLIIVVLWIDPNLLPWYETSIGPQLFGQFRHLLRILIFGSFSLITLAALGLDAAWRWLLDRTEAETRDRKSRISTMLANAGLLLIWFLMVAGASDLFRANQPYLRTQPVDSAAYRVMQGLGRYDAGIYYIRLNPNNLHADAPAATGMRFSEVWYHFADILDTTHSITARPLAAKPRYIIQDINEPPPSEQAATEIYRSEGFSIYRMPHSLPFAFSIANSNLQNINTGEVRREEVQHLAASAPTPNKLEVVAESRGEEILVVLTAHYPGWQVNMDGRRAALLNANGYLATQLAPGVHHYEFVFRPVPFYLGLIISLLSLGLTLVWALSEVRFDPAMARAGARRAFEQMHAAWGRVWRKRRRDHFTAEGVYRAGVLEPDQPLDLADGAAVHLTVDVLPAPATPWPASWRRWLWATADLARAIPLPMVLFALSLGIYAFTRLWALESFPIYFFGDEAVQTLFAESLINQKFTALDGTLFPIYVEAAAMRWTPLLSMYFHAVTLILFGKSIFVCRATSAVITLLSAAAVGWMLKSAFRTRTWWAGALLVGLTPAWFLHSRTAFETALTTTFYACTLLAYLLYRQVSPRYLYAAIAFGAATFYTYSNAQAIVLALAALLFLSDLRYHLRHPVYLGRGLLLALALAVPIIGFRISHPEAFGDHLRMVGSYWYQPLGLGEKLRIFLLKYSYGLSPQYWFFPNPQEIPRHRMGNLGYLPTWVLPLFLLGLGISLTRLRQSPYRAVLLSALAIPVGASLVDIGIARVLAFIIPANILAALGLDALVSLFTKRLPEKLLTLVLFAGLAWGNLALLRTALVDGPLWFHDYGLYGMQYGARQLFEETIPTYLEKDPQANILVSSTWANGADNFLRFFFNEAERQRVRMDGVENYLFRQLPLSKADIFVMTASEYAKAVESPKFGTVILEQVIPYPDGTPGFYFTRLAYAENIDEIFAAEKEARRKLVEDTVTINGERVQIRHSQIDMGMPQYIFDGDHFTLMRGLEANPFTLELTFDQPRPLTTLRADFGMVNVTLTVQLFAEPGGESQIFRETFLRASADPQIEMQLTNGPQAVRAVRLEILDIQNLEITNIHIRELELLP